MRIALYGLLTALCGLQLMYSQQGPGRRRPNEKTPPPRDAIVFVTPAWAPQSLRDLVEKSDAIVLGTVKRAVGRLKPGDSRDIETDFFVSVTEVLKPRGELNNAEIIVAERGGTFEGRQDTRADDTLLAPGETHVLFLGADRRLGLPLVPDTPRFIVRGLWQGKVKIEQGKVRIRNYQTAQWLREHDGEDAAKFLNSIRTVLQ